MSRVPEIVEELRALLPGDLVRYHYINALLDEIKWWAEWETTKAKIIEGDRRFWEGKEGKNESTSASHKKD